MPLHCDECGFIYGDLALEDVPARIAAGVDRLCHDLAHGGDLVRRRPAPDRWSALEYASHVRDVLLSIRERIITAVIVDTPTGVPLYRDDRVARGLYDADTTADLVEELVVAGRLLGRIITALPDGAGERLLIYSPNFAGLGPTTVAWCAAQAVHEVEHHGSDVIVSLEG